MADPKGEKHIFGPVPSRRLGRSLGVDLVPYKTCTYDCIYCQLGKTDNKTPERKEWVPLAEVLGQIRENLKHQPDYITLSGSGEPTLYSKLGQLLRGIKQMTDIPVAVLTNGSLLWQPQVRSELQQADLVMPSLDAGSIQKFRYVNRPCDGIEFEKMVQGLIQFREEYSGKYWLEVLIMAGITTPESEIRKMAEYIKQIRPDRVLVNTVARPPVEEYAEPVPERQLKALALQLSENAEVIADYTGVHQKKEFTAQRSDVLEMLHRRPCTVEDISSGLEIHRNEAVKYIEELLHRGLIKKRIQNRQTYYAAAEE